jgi:transposase-like protein
MGKMMALIILIMGITQRSLKAIMVRLNLLFPEIVVAVIAQAIEWRNRPLDEVCPIVYLDVKLGKINKSSKRPCISP